MKIKIETYSELEKWAGAFADNHINLLIIVGNPGLSKTQIIKNTIQEKARWICGTVSPFQLYIELHQHLDYPLVIDDVDSLYRDKTAVRLLKCLCQTDEIKTVAWHTATNKLDKLQIPRQFQTSSKVCIICNEWKLLNKNIGAIEDRGTLIVFDPPKQAIHERTLDWFKDKEIYDFIGDNLKYVKEPTMRHYINALEAKNAHLNWKDALFQSFGLSKAEIKVLNLLDNRGFSKEEERVGEFVGGGFGARSTYFRLKERLGQYK